MSENKRKLYTRNFTFLVIGQIVSLFGSAIQRFALSLYILEMTGSASVFASILAFSIVPVILLAPFAGVMADRFNKRNIMVILDFISSVILAIYAGILMTGNDHYLIVAIMMVLLSGISTLYQPSVTASIPLLVEEENLMQANGIVQQVSSISNFAGPIIAGVIYGFLGIKGIIIINLISFFLSAVMEMFITIPYTKQEKKASPIQGFLHELKESYEYLKNENRVIFRMCITSGLYNLFLVPLLTVGAPYIIKVHLNQSSEFYGLAEGAIAFGMIIGAVVVGRMPARFHIKRIHRVLYFASVCMAMMAAALAFAADTNTGHLIAFSCFTFFAMGIMVTIGMANVVSATFIQQSTPNNMLGKISAFGAAFATICVPLGQMIFGALLDVMINHVWLMVLVSGIATLFVTLLVRYNVSQIEE
ncbi:MAG: MFS transporter [bacterium]|nr:MFS transporter [bacterium]